MALHHAALRTIRKYPTAKQFIKFGVVGGTSAIINFSIYFSFTKYLGWWYLYSSVLGFVVSAIFNFTSNKFWTFRNPARGRAIIRQAMMFSTVTVSGLIINTIILYILTDWFLFDWRLSWVCATGVVTFWNFGLNRFWTFRHHEPLPGLSIEGE